ncbi:MAG: hypothetical protein ACK56F_00465, partial [bacterium]
MQPVVEIRRQGDLKSRGRQTVKGRDDIGKHPPGVGLGEPVEEVLEAGFRIGKICDHPCHDLTPLRQLVRFTGLA